MNQSDSSGRCGTEREFHDLNVGVGVGADVQKANEFEWHEPSSMRKIWAIDSITYILWMQ